MITQTPFSEWRFLFQHFKFKKNQAEYQCDFTQKITETDWSKMFIESNDHSAGYKAVNEV
ncbi:hypothetical protein D3C71_974010 [compost metagenome]